MKNILKKIIKIIEDKNETVIHEGLLCKAYDCENGVLLWVKSTGWLGLRESKKYHCHIENKEKISYRNIPIFKQKEDKIYYLKPDLQKLLSDMKYNFN